jgi:hypothetical protein
LSRSTLRKLIKGGGPEQQPASILLCWEGEMDDGQLSDRGWDRTMRNQVERVVLSRNTLSKLIKGGGPEQQPVSLLLCWEGVMDDRQLSDRGWDRVMRNQIDLGVLNRSTLRKLLKGGGQEQQPSWLHCTPLLGR